MSKIDEYLKYLNQIDLVESNDPEIFEFLKETADSFTDIDLSTLLENIALSFDNRKKEYSALDSHSLKNIKIKEWRELYTYANHRFNRYGVYANATYDKYKSVLVEALEFCETEARKLSNNAHKKSAEKPKKQGRPKTVIHDASYYLQDKEILSFLIESYSNVEPQVFNQLMCVLDEMELLKSATNKEYKESFGEALNVNQTQTNFNDNFRKKKIEEIFNPIKNRIKAFLDRD